ncbi:septum formation initiator family protein [Natroniella acetigena]|uniref:FtsB family cell division protein n=1 Tax=Natroniella acetigena TaxID=52004 RepID=UPI00200B8C72|nr:septum formation initiator family protein [Natroniella acetigena]MCK8827134.1 septum formation initiator family protein [Natroniella acetigena]
MKNKGYQQKRVQRSSKNNKQKKYTFKYMVVGGIIISLIVLFLVLYINQYVQISRKNLRVETLEEERQQVKRDKLYLQLQISRLQSLARIEEVAKDEFNMVEPNEIHYLVLEEDTLKEDYDQDEFQSETEDSKFNFGERLVIWLKGLTQVEAGSLD